MQEGDINAAKWWLERRRRSKFATRQEVANATDDGGNAIPFRIVDYRAGFTETEE